jgi:hypothetical protein
MANFRPDGAAWFPIFSSEAHEMLRIPGENHRREVTNDEWSRYAGRSISETLCVEYWRRWISRIARLHGCPLASKRHPKLASRRDLCFLSGHTADHEFLDPLFQVHTNF